MATVARLPVGGEVRARRWFCRRLHARSGSPSRPHGARGAELIADARADSRAGHQLKVDDDVAEQNMDHPRDKSSAFLTVLARDDNEAHRRLEQSVNSTAPAPASLAMMYRESWLPYISPSPRWRRRCTCLSCHETTYPSPRGLLERSRLPRPKRQRTSRFAGGDRMQTAPIHPSDFFFEGLRSK